MQVSVLVDTTLMTSETARLLRDASASGMTVPLLSAAWAAGQRNAAQRCLSLPPP